MNKGRKKLQIILSIIKIIFLVILFIQYIFAAIWISQNILVVPTFQVVKESFFYNEITIFFGKFYWVLYLGQAVSLYFAISKLTKKNHWAAGFVITNPIVLQFTFALVPDVFSISILIFLIGSLLQKEKISTKHATALLLLGALHERYFIVGIGILSIFVIQNILNNRLRKLTSQDDEKVVIKKESTQLALQIIQLVCVFAFISVTYIIRIQAGDMVGVVDKIQSRVEVIANSDTNGSALSVGKGIVNDTFSLMIAPISIIHSFSGDVLTQNGWNYYVFTRVSPQIGKNYMEIALRNLLLALSLCIITQSILCIKKRYIPSIKTIGKKLGILILIYGMTCFFLVITSIRGMDYRNAIFSILLINCVVGYYYKQIEVEEKKGGNEECSLEA